MVFQDYALYPQMTVFDNLAFGLRRRKVPEPGDQAAGGSRPRACSGSSRSWRGGRGSCRGGQAQRVALGRALVRDPQVFLMDEPLSNLDAKLRTQTRGEIRRLQQEVRTTTVYVTHDQVEAMTMGDRIAVMNDGVLEQVGTPGGALRAPREPLRRRLHRLARDGLRRGRRDAVADGQAARAGRGRRACAPSTRGRGATA